MVLHCMWVAWFSALYLSEELPTCRNHCNGPTVVFAGYQNPVNWFAGKLVYSSIQSQHSPDGGEFGACSRTKLCGGKAYKSVVWPAKRVLGQKLSIIWMQRLSQWTLNRSTWTTNPVLGQYHPVVYSLVRPCAASFTRIREKSGRKSTPNDPSHWDPMCSIATSAEQCFRALCPACQCGDHIPLVLCAPWNCRSLDSSPYLFLLLPMANPVSMHQLNEMGVSFCCNIRRRNANHVVDSRARWPEPGLSLAC